MALIALVCRVGKGCRQYPFETLEALEKWAARKPYSGETLRVMAIGDDQRIIEERTVAASDAVEFIRGLRPWKFNSEVQHVYI